MTELELAQIESELQIRLPSVYRHTMLDYPFAEYSWPDQAEIPDNATFVLHLNSKKRMDDQYAEVWCNEWFAFGNDSGLLYLIDTSLTPSPVFRFDVESQELTEDAATLEEWIERRIEWYVRFDAKALAEKYATLRSAVEEAGFYTTGIEPMGGWDRVTIASIKSSEGSYTGNSFWVSCDNGEWLLGTWGGLIYQLKDIDRVAECCISWLKRAPRQTRSDFDDFIKSKYNLIPVPDDE